MTSASVLLPQSPEEVTPAWLTQTFRAAGVLAEANITDVRHERIGQGVGFVGMIVRLTLTYDRAEPDAPPTIVAKFPSPDAGARQTAIIFGLYEREVRFYQDVAARISLDTPRCYLAAMDPAAGRYLVVLEDLADGRFGDQVAGCSLDDARLAVQRLARFHAEWWRNPDLGDFAWMPRAVDLVGGALAAAYAPSWIAFLERFGDRLTPELHAAGADMGSSLMGVLAALSERPETMSHSDFRVDNLFFGAPHTGRPLVVVDWQAPLRSWGGSYDLIYFLAGGLPTEVRRAHESMLIEEYHRALTAHGVTDYSLAELREDCRTGLLFVFAVIGVIAGGTLDIVNDRAVALFETIFDRLLPAMDDYRSLKLLPRA